MIKITHQSILDLLDYLGIMFGHSSGGFYIPNTYLLIQDLETNAPILVSEDRRSIRFYDGDLFLKSIQTTEKMFCLKLFN